MWTSVSPWAEALLKAGADVNNKGKIGETPMAGRWLNLLAWVDRDWFQRLKWS
jgi:hypothetical protein